jgi:ribosomal protein L21E
MCITQLFTDVSESNPYVTLDGVTGLVANATGRSTVIVCRVREGKEKVKLSP